MHVFYTDLQTQAGYQQMDSRFIGLIFSVYNEDKKTKVKYRYGI